MDLDFDQSCETDARASNHPLRDGLAHMYSIPKRPSVNSQPPEPQPIPNTARDLPTLHHCCVKGDLPGVLQCITDGCNVDEGVTLRNRLGHDVSGVTPLFLAAQRGFKPLCKLLIENGANARHACYIVATAEQCTPAQVAQQNLHILLAFYLRKQISKRKEEDAVLALDDVPAPTPRPSLAAALDFGGLGALFGMGRSASGGLYGDDSDSSGGGGKAPGRASGVSGGGTAAGVFMQELDLSQWDPCLDETASAQLDSQQMKTAMRRRSVDMSAEWPGANNPQGDFLEPSRSAPVEEADLNGPAGTDHTAAAAADSRTLVPDTNGAAAVAEPAPKRADVKHKKMVKKFLKEVDFSQMVLE